MDIITGKTKPDSGHVLWGEKSTSLLALSESKIAQAGIGRKFQRPTVFEDQSVSDNLMMALKNRVVPLPYCASRQARKIMKRFLIWPARLDYPAHCTEKPGSCHMVRNNGWKSACCWHRTRGCFWWMNPPPA